MTPPGRFALIPMKRFDQAKSRLQPQLSAPARSALARAMFEHVLHTAVECSGLTGVLVLTNGDDVAAVSAGAGARVLADPAANSGKLGALIDRGLEHLAAQGATAALVLMADLPLLQTEDLTQLLAALDTHRLVLTKDSSGRCTNALGARLRLPMPTAFGHADSYALHLQRARALSLEVLELDRARVARDVDTYADLPAPLQAAYPPGH